MSVLGRTWDLPPAVDPAEAAALAQACRVPAAVARVLHRRGLADPRAAATFLRPGPPPDPGTVPGMPEAVAGLALAARRGERVLIFGDYDCDGICSTAVAFQGLRAFGLAVHPHLPARADGYGMQPETLVALARRHGCARILAVDNGSTAVEAVAAAAAAGIEVVVADHHQLGERLPEAAVVNPRRDPGGAWEGLAGVGVTWCLLQALGAELGAEPPAAFDLVAVGTIADVAPMLGVNRVLVRLGLRAMGAQGLRPGLRALLDLCQVAPGQVPQVRDVSHGVAPRLNAPGRLDHPRPALDLLLAGDTAAAQAALAVVDAANTRRRALEAEIVTMAQEAASALPATTSVVVLADRRWPHGLLGPAASKLVEHLGKPVLLAEITSAGRCRGSGRGPAGWDLTGALRQCADHLRRYGGHQQAAGFEFDLTALDDLRAALTPLAPPSAAGPQLPLVVDAVLEAGEVTPDLVAALDNLAPHGPENPQPAFLLHRASATEARPVGVAGDHLSLRLQLADGRRVAAIGFGLGLWAGGSASPWDLIVHPQINRFRGSNRLQLQVVDIDARDDWGGFLRGVRHDLDRRHPNRAHLTQAFRLLAGLARGGPLPPDPALIAQLTRVLPDVEAARAALCIFREIGLLDPQGALCLPEAGRKLDLRHSRRYRAAEAAHAAAAELAAAVGVPTPG